MGLQDSTSSAGPSGDLLRLLGRGRTDTDLLVSKPGIAFFLGDRRRLQDVDVVIGTVCVVPVHSSLKQIEKNVTE